MGKEASGLDEGAGGRLIDAPESSCCRPEDVLGERPIAPEK